MYNSSILNENCSLKVNKASNFILFLFYIVFIFIFFNDWLFFVFGIGSRYLSWIPEFFSIFLLIYLPAILSVNGKLLLPLKYFILISIYVMIIIIGFLFNSMNFGPIFAGSRQFLRFLPVFILPNIVFFEEKDILNTFKFFLFLSILQLPVTIWQKFYLYSNIYSGDPVGGTLGINTSGVLTIFLLIAISFITAFYMKEFISVKLYSIFLICLIIPTCLNETKITIPLLPLSILLPIIFMNKNTTNNKYKKFIFLAACLLTSFFTFIFFYNIFYSRNIISFYSNKNIVSNYSSARLLPISKAFVRDQNKQLEKLIFGYGAGNLSVSFSENFQGKLLRQFSAYKPTKVSISKMLWEIGYLGTLLFFLMILNIFYDIFKHTTNNNLVDAISTGFLSFTIFFIISLFYTKPLDQNIFVYLYFFYGGWLISLQNYSRIDYI